MTYKSIPGRFAADSCVRISSVAFLTVLAGAFELHALGALTVQQTIQMTGIGFAASTGLCLLGRLIRNQKRA